MKEDNDQRTAQLGVSALLAATGGFLDGFTYVGHGHVFAAAMTGNLVLLGINLWGGSVHVALHHVPPVVAFLLGIHIAKAFELACERNKIRNSSLVVLGFEIGLLLTLSLLPQSTPDAWFTTTIAFAAALQVQTFHQVHGWTYNSTFITGNLRSMSEGSFDWMFRGRDMEAALKMRDFAIICGLFLMGAMTGGFTAGRFGNIALWLPAAVLALAAASIWPRDQRPLDRQARASYARSQT